MTTIVDALNRIARQVSVEAPTNWITAAATEHVEIRDDFLPEVVDEILQRKDLPAPFSAQYVLPTDGSETYAMPADFLRMQRAPMSVYESLGTRRALVPVSDDGVWTHLKSVGSTGITRYYRLRGYPANWQMDVYREPTAAQTITVSYVTTRWMATSGGALGSAFTNLGDVLLFPRRLIETGVVARWRMRKGIPAEGSAMEFESELNRFSQDSRTRRVINFGGPDSDMQIPDIPVPDFIPSA